MNIFDCFMYNNEELVLDLRLNLLSKNVKKFVLIESAYDHQGNRKKNLFNIENFKKFKNQITYLLVDNFPDKLVGSWERENYQRNYIFNGIKDANENDFIIISDVDEIPNLNKLNNLQSFKYTAFKQMNLCYKMNLINNTYPEWFGSRICKKKYLKSPQWLRDIKTKKRPFWKFYKPKEPQLIFNGGWHFSFLKKPKDIAKKIKAYSHQEFNKDDFVDEKKIEERINNGKDLFNRSFEYKKIEIDESFPKYILENRAIFEEWII